jgi:hypothetical protein
MLHAERDNLEKRENLENVTIWKGVTNVKNPMKI